MRFRPATESDLPALRAFLEARAERAMFPLASLHAHGLARGHERASRFWLAGEPIAGALALTEGGFVNLVMPEALAVEAARCLAGETVAGFSGEAAATRAVRRAVGLGGAPARLDATERHLALRLADLVMPYVDGCALRPLAEAPRALMLDWAAAYEVEALGAGPDLAREEAGRHVDRWAAAATHKVLWRGAEPAARTGFNARAPGIVQVGGVYVPPPLRGRGLARAAVALHLAEARAEGASRATLFATNPAALRAYAALGFRPIGDFLLCLLAAPQIAHAP